MAATTQIETDDLLRRVRDLIFLRDLLAERGATAAELREYDEVIAAAREELAEVARVTAAAA